MLDALNDPKINKIIALSGDDTWRADLDRLINGDTTLTRESAGEAGIRAVQRLLIFLGYSTASSGAFIVDGDFGRGTNRGIAQFQYENELTHQIDRAALCYDCSFQTARKRIVAIPDASLDIPTLEKMLTSAQSAIDNNQVTFGQLDDALFHLNSLHRGRFLTCKEVNDRYGSHVKQAISAIRQDKGLEIQPEWILSIIKQETSGIVRPRFEQHKLSKFNKTDPGEDLAELRLRSMSIGLGQIMGFNHKQVCAPSARAMLFSPVTDQVLYVARFISRKKDIVSKADPTIDDFRKMARFYNGPKYEAHFYHEKLQTWFREFKTLT
jgi:peptidoglycan hydrolase-like protein with peptidoglycan-binding domain